MEETFTFDPDQMRSVTYRLTNALRWRDGILEQAWQGDDATVRWEPVPHVETATK